MVDPAVAWFWASWQDDDLDGPAALVVRRTATAGSSSRAFSRGLRSPITGTPR
jgi:hypothetical protein